MGAMVTVATVWWRAGDNDGGEGVARGRGRILGFFDYQRPDNQAQDLKYQINQYLSKS